MSDTAKNFGNLNRLPISALAEKQQSQGKLNHCAYHSIATVMNIHFGWHIDGAELAQEFDSRWWRTPFRYRMWPNWATAPFQAQQVIRKIARDLKFPLRTQLKKFSDTYLINTLHYSPNHYPVVTFLWLKGPLQLQSHKGARAFPIKSLPGFGAHTMLLAAYNPENRDDNGVLHPWGFVNSWATPGITDLFWMSEETWQKTFKLRTLMIILN